MSTRKSTMLLMGCFLVTLFCLFYPLYVIGPWRPQGVTELKVALTVVRLRFWPMLAACALALVAVANYWRAHRPSWKRPIFALAGLLVLAFTALSRVNIYELMFHPVDRPQFIAVESTNLDGDEKVLAVRMGAEARAYPIRNISYHHIVNDRLGGVPIVATY